MARKSDAEASDSFTIEDVRYVQSAARRSLKMIRNFHWLRTFQYSISIFTTVSIVYFVGVQSNPDD